MKSDTKDKTAGKTHQMKGKFKLIAGKAGKRCDPEVEDKDENRDGNGQEKSGPRNKAYEEMFATRLKESRLKFVLLNPRKDTAPGTETKIEFYKRIQAARAAMRKQPKPK